MTVKEWLTMAKGDAERRGGAELAAALEGFAKSTEALRAADWNHSEWERRSAGRGRSSDLPAGESEDSPLR
jgi:hypothetical protein